MATRSVVVYQYPKCSTCRKAMAWLSAQKLPQKLLPRFVIESHDLVAHPPSAQTIRDLHRRSGLPLARLFNTSGESYRNGDWKRRLPSLSEAEAYAALAADGKLIKRPIVDLGSRVLVGFDEAAYGAAVK